MENDLLRTKLHVPPLPEALVPRPRLLARLDAALSEEGRWRRKMTLVSAPAGYGKTTLLSAWRAGARYPVIWLSLEERDNDLPRFLAYLVAALQQVHQSVGQTTMTLLAAGQLPSVESLLAPLLNELAAQPTALAIVLDDYHAIQVDMIHEAITFFVEHQPSQVHLVVITREDPSLPLARWRAAGQLAEIRMGDLRFSLSESAAFLQDVMGLRLTAEQVAALETRTEGWIAGLQLAAVAMRGRDDVEAFVASFAGSNRYVLDYLLEEVFGQQSPTVQDFLLATSILDRFSAPLCDAVLATRHAGHDPALAQPATQSILEHLERVNLFVVALDDQRQWFRYHHLFAELLRHQLRLRGWETEALHRAAGCWCAEQEMPATAINHFLAGRDWQQAAVMLGRYSDQLLRRGESRTLLRWIQAMPEDVIRHQPRLCTVYAWALILNGQLETAVTYLDEAIAASAGSPDVHRDVLGARAYIARMRHDLPQTISLSRQALALTPEADANTRAVLAVGLGIAHWQSGQMKEADQALFEAVQAAQQSQNDYVQLVSTGFLATVRAAMGQLRTAADLLQGALRWGGDAPPAAMAHHIMGALLYEWDNLDGAATHIEQAVELARRSANVELIEGAYRQLARLRQAQGDRTGALAALAEAWRAVGEQTPPLARSRIAAAYVQLALAQGDISTAAHWAAQRSLPIDASPFYPHLNLMPARLSLAGGEEATAARHLEAESKKATQAGWQYGLVEIRVLQALASAGEETALSFLADALAQAHSEGYIRTFVDKGEPLAALLRRVTVPASLADYAQTVLHHFGSQTEPALTPAPPPTTPSSPLVEPLSEREQEILGLLARRRTNAEIAQTLTVSINTVKTHLRHIYEKLDVHDRQAAVVRARSLGLLPASQG